MEVIILMLILLRIVYPVKMKSPCIAGTLRILTTRKDSTLRELILLILDGNSNLQGKINTARYSFRLVYFDNGRDRFTSKEIGTITGRSLQQPPRDAPKDRKTREDTTLESAGFVVGDYLDVAILGTQPPSRAPEPRWGNDRRNWSGNGRRPSDNAWGPSRDSNRRDRPRERSQSPGAKRGGMVSNWD